MKKWRQSSEKKKSRREDCFVKRKIRVEKSKSGILWSQFSAKGTDGGGVMQRWVWGWGRDGDGVSAFGLCFPLRSHR